MSIVKTKAKKTTPPTTATEVPPESSAVQQQQVMNGGSSHCKSAQHLVISTPSHHLPLHAAVVSPSTSPTHHHQYSSPSNNSVASGDGLYCRHRRSPDKQLSPQQANSIGTPSPTIKMISPTKSPSSSPKGGPFRRRRLPLLVLLLLGVSIVVTLSFSFYLLNQVPLVQDGHRNRVSLPAEAPIQPVDANRHYYKDSKPRTVYWDDANHGFKQNAVYTRTLDAEPAAPPGLEAVEQDDYHEKKHRDTDCVPQSEWQTSSFPNCNMLHELELRAAGQDVGNKHSANVGFEDNIMYMGRGWFRAAWQVDLDALNETVVLKTLRSEREFYSEYYELHRRDAVAMERLTFSPFVMDIYGFCGQSAINEMASFGHGGLTSLEKFDRELRGKESKQAYFIKLQIATSVAVGVAHVHQVNGADARPAMVHYDLNPRNIAIVKGGKPKLNDFNTAEFLRINPKTNETCGFPSRLHEPWWRAPEEVIKLPKPDTRLVDEKVDVYSLGSILYHILTTHSPRGKMKKERMEFIRREVAVGKPPVLTDYYTKSKDPAIVAMVKAMKLCHKVDPKKRASATQVADILLEALMDIRKNDPARTKFTRK